GRVAVAFEHDNQDHEVSFQRSETDRSLLINEITGLEYEGWLEHSQYVGSIPLNRSTNLLLGAELKSEGSESAGDKNERNQQGFFAELQAEPFKNLFITAGWRQDDNDDFGNHHSYRASVAYLQPLNDEHLLKFRASIGTGFRAP